MPIPKRQGGFTLWELIVVACLVILLFAVALENLLPLRGAAERAQVLHVEGTLRSALGLQASERVIRNGIDGLRPLTRENPLEWLAVRPPTADVAALKAMPKGRWSWFPQSNMLAYRLRYPEYVEAAYADEWLRYRVVFSDATDRQSANLALVAMDPVRWTLPAELIQDTRENLEENDDALAD